MEVTNHDDTVKTLETEVQKAQQKVELQKNELLDLEKKHIQMMEEKNILAEQLQAESELCAEAEEVRS